MNKLLEPYIINRNDGYDEIEVPSYEQILADINDISRIKSISLYANSVYVYFYEVADFIKICADDKKIFSSRFCSVQFLHIMAGDYDLQGGYAENCIPRKVDQCADLQIGYLLCTYIPTQPPSHNVRCVVPHHKYGQYIHAYLRYDVVTIVIDTEIWLVNAVATEIMLADMLEYLRLPSRSMQFIISVTNANYYVELLSHFTYYTLFVKSVFSFDANPILLNASVCNLRLDSMHDITWNIENLRNNFGILKFICRKSADNDEIEEILASHNRRFATTKSAALTLLQ